MFSALRDNHDDELHVLRQKIEATALALGIDLECGRTFAALLDGRIQRLSLPAGDAVARAEWLATLLRLYVRLQNFSLEDSSPVHLARLWGLCREVIEQEAETSFLATTAVHHPQPALAS